MKPTSTAANDGVAEAHAFGGASRGEQGDRWTQLREIDERAVPSARAFEQSSQPYPLWFRSIRQPLSMMRAEKASHMSIPVPIRNNNSRTISSSASRIILGRRESQHFSLLQTHSTFVSSWAYCLQKPELPVMHQMCKKSSRSSCYHRQPHLQQQRLVL